MRKKAYEPLVRLLSLARAAMELAEAESLALCRSNSSPRFPTKNLLLTPSDLIWKGRGRDDERRRIEKV